MSLSTVFEAISDLSLGRVILVVDAVKEPAQGDLICTAERVTPEVVNFMARHGKGLICLALTEERVRDLELPMMVVEGESSVPMGREPFTVSIEARAGVETGISASDRATTIRAAIAPGTRPSDLARPGHVFPLRTRTGGVLKRASAAEAAVDLARMAGLHPSGVLCKVLGRGGELATADELEELARKHDLKMVSIADLIAHRMRTEHLVRRIAHVHLPTAHGQFEAYGYSSTVDPQTHLALVRGELRPGDDILVRVHSECLTGDVFGSMRCDCGSQLEMAMERIAAETRGVLLYLRQEGRGIGLANKLLAYQLQDEGHDTVQANLALGFPPDFRDYGIGAQILADLGVRRLRVLTNNPKKLRGLELYGLTVVERVPLEAEPQADNLTYLRTKRSKLGHMLSRIDTTEK
jgi:3,4-dihydroxy 2-butanone 4-phosphate synthase / GTP cyclohydrolase II